MLLLECLGFEHYVSKECMLNDSMASNCRVHGMWVWVAVSWFTKMFPNPSI